MLCTRELASFDSSRPHVCFKANKSEKPGTDPRKPKGELIYVHVRCQMIKWSLGYNYKRVKADQVLDLETIFFPVLRLYPRRGKQENLVSGFYLLLHTLVPHVPWRSQTLPTLPRTSCFGERERASERAHAHIDTHILYNHHLTWKCACMCCTCFCDKIKKPNSSFSVISGNCWNSDNDFARVYLIGKVGYVDIILEFTSGWEVALVYKFKSQFAQRQ